MTEEAARAVVAALAIGVPMGLVWLRMRPRRVQAGRVPSELGPFPAVLLFSSARCPTCPPAQELVTAMCGSAVRELTWPADTVAFHKLGVGTVPATFVVDSKGKVVERFDGVPDVRRLRRTSSRAGLQTG